MEYMTVKDTSLKWNISSRQVQLLCAKGKINGVTRFGQSWAVPVNAEKPLDGRKKKL